MESAYDTRTILFRTFLVISYTCFGSGIFYILERDEASQEATKFEEFYNESMRNILSGCVFNETEIHNVMKNIREKFLQKTFPIEWNFLLGLKISVQTLTTIGYGDIVPKTLAGRMFLIVYATVGIPLMAMMLTTFGDKVKHSIRKSVIFFESKILKRTQPQNIQKKSLIAVFFVTLVFLCTVSAASVEAEDWDFSLAFYVWFVTFTTIGFGDYVPKGTERTQGALYALEITFAICAYFLGLTLIATILHALSDWVQSKTPPTKDDIKRSLGRVSSTLPTTVQEVTLVNYNETPC